MLSAACRALALLAAAAMPCLGQSRAADFASPFLPAGHWSLDALRRVVALGLGGDAVLWPDGSPSRRAAGLALRDAAALADRERRELAPAVRGYWERFREEFPATARELDATERRRVLATEGSASAGLLVGRGQVGTGFSDWRQTGGTGPVPLEDPDAAVGEVDWAASLSPYLALHLAPRYDTDWGRSEGYVYGAYRRAGIWLGRRALQYGPGEGGGVITNATSPVDGGGLVIEPFRLPWLFRYLGRAGFEGTLSRIDSSNAIKHPWVMLLHASLAPHPRLQLGANWGAIFSGSGRPPLTWRNFYTMIKEQRAVFVTGGTEFEDQLASIEIRFRPPLRVPIVVYTEWGAEDNHSAWWDVPGIVVGAEVASIPGVPALALGLEHAYFDEPCVSCGTSGFGSNWYRHYIYHAGWAVDPIPLGHPLGGDGREWLAFGRLDLLEARLRLDGRVFWRDRGYYNLYAPEREGRSTGVALKAHFRARPALDFSLDGMVEDGARDWRQGSLRGAARFIF